MTHGIKSLSSVVIGRGWACATWSGCIVKGSPAMQVHDLVTVVVCLKRVKDVGAHFLLCLGLDSALLVSVCNG